MKLEDKADGFSFEAGAREAAGVVSCLLEALNDSIYEKVVFFYTDRGK